MDTPSVKKTPKTYGETPPKIYSFRNPLFILTKNLVHNNMADFRHHLSEFFCRH